MITNLDHEILSTYPIAKSLSVIDKNLHGHRLKFLTRQVDGLLVLIMLFQQRPVAEPMCSLYSTRIKDLIEHLSNTTSFLLSHIA
jgi:hypothetical protein